MQLKLLNFTLHTADTSRMSEEQILLKLKMHPAPFYQKHS